jgi:hypothetical protein
MDRQVNGRLLQIVAGCWRSGRLILRARTFPAHLAALDLIDYLVDVFASLFAHLASHAFRPASHALGIVLV